MVERGKDLIEQSRVSWMQTNNSRLAGAHIVTYMVRSPTQFHTLQESEGEDAETSRVTLSQDMGRGNVASRQSRVRLYEIGPRMELEVIKVWGSMEKSGEMWRGATLLQGRVACACLRSGHAWSGRLSMCGEVWGKEGSVGWGNITSGQSRMRLCEIGPRMEEEGLCNGKPVITKNPMHPSSAPQTVNESMTFNNHPRCTLSSP